MEESEDISDSSNLIVICNFKFKIYPAFMEADVVVFASPVYFWDVTGTLKTAIDRLYAVYRSAGSSAYPKESVLLMISGGSMIDHMLDWYRNFDIGRIHD